MATDALTIKVTADTRQAVDSVEKLNDALSETRDEAKNLFAKGLAESLPEQLQDVAKGFNIARDGSAGFTTRLQAGVGATLIAKNAIMDLGSRLIDVARAFGENAAAMEQEQRALRALGTTYDSVRAATSNTTSATDAFAMRQTLLRAGLSANNDVMARVARLGREYANTYGGSATEAVNTFVQAVQSGDQGALAQFGVRLTNSKNAADRLSQSLDVLGERYSRTAAAERTAAETQQAFERGLTRLRQSAISGLNDALLGIPGLLHQATVAVGDMVQAERGVEDATDRASRGLERQAEAARTTATATAALTSELSKADEQLKAFEQTLQEAPSYTLAANETFQEGVSRATQQAVNQIARARAQRRLQRAVRQALGRTANAQDLQDAQLPADAVARTDYASLFANRARRKRVDWQVLNGYSNEQMDARDAWEQGLGATRAEMASQVEVKRREQLIYEAEQNAATNERNLSFARGVSQSGEDRYQGSLDYERRQQRGIFGNAADQFSERFGATRTAAEQQVALTQQTAESISGAYDQMTSGLNGFLDTLIESPEKAGEASVNLAKGVLKGIAMMAVQKSIFSLAEGFAALGSANPASATQFFIASGIYAGVAVGAGAGAAGIAAAQRGTQPTPPATAGSMNSGPARIGSGSGSNREVPMYTININGSVLDEGGMEDAIVRGIRGARARGALN